MINKLHICAAILLCTLFPLTGFAAPSTLLVGGLFGMTGSNATYGEQQTRGIAVAFDDINASGGAGGTMLKLQPEDHGGVASKGVLAFNKLISINHVPFVFTSFTNIISATAPIGTQHHVVMMNGGATGPDLAKLSPYLFSNVPLETAHIKNEATYAIQKLHKKTLGVLYVNDALGTGDADAMKATWKELGGDVVAVASADTDAMNFTSQLTQIKHANPDAIYIAAGGRQVAAALNQKKELGIESLILGTSFWTIPEVLTTAKGASEGIIFSTQRWDPNKPGNDAAVAFVNEFVKRYGVKPLGNSAAYFVGAHILADTVTELNKSNKELTGPNIREALLHHGSYDTIFGPLTFAANGTSTMPLTLMTVKDDQFVELPN